MSFWLLFGSWLISVWGWRRCYRGWRSALIELRFTRGLCWHAHASLVRAETELARLKNETGG